MDTEMMASHTGPTVAMIGGGFMARTHTHGARLAGATLEALAASTLDRSRTVARELGYARGAETDALLAEGLPVVHLCTPNLTHRDYAIAALEAGSFVICEKPLATTADDARAVAVAAERAGVPGAVPFVYRYHPMVIEARARVAAGETGPVLTIAGTYLQDWLLAAADDNWRVDADRGGPSRAFADIGSHLVDLLEFVTNDRIVRLVATTSRVHDERSGRAVTTEDAVALTVELSGGGIGTLLVSQVAPGRKNGLTLEVSGLKETLRFEQEDPERLWVGRRGASLLLRRDPETLSPDAARVTSLPAGHPEGYQSAFDAFVRDAYAAAADPADPPAPLATFADGVRAAVVTDAVLESARNGSWVEVPGS